MDKLVSCESSNCYLIEKIKWCPAQESNPRFLITKELFCR